MRLWKPLTRITVACALAGTTGCALLASVPDPELVPDEPDAGGDASLDATAADGKPAPDATDLADRGPGATDDAGADATEDAAEKDAGDAAGADASAGDAAGTDATAGDAAGADANAGDANADATSSDATSSDASPDVSDSAADAPSDPCISATMSTFTATPGTVAPDG